jgi:hypothetical protein
MAQRSVTVGIDTHKYIHVAVALTERGRRLGDITVAGDPGGYEQLLAWARSFGEPWCFGVEGCGSYGQGLVRHLRRHGQRVVEAGRPKRDLPLHRRIHAHYHTSPGAEHRTPITH